MHPRWMVTLSCLVIGATGCMSAAVGSKGTQHVHATDNARASGRFIPAGRQLSVRLEQPLDTAVSARGTAFTAVVLQPVQDSTGAVLIPVGARLRGHVHSVEGATGERLRLRFEGIDTVLGQASIAARVDNAEYTRYLGAPRFIPSYGASSWGYPYPVGGGPGYRSWYGDWGYYNYDVYIPREVHLPVGAAMHLTLTRPLLAPGEGVLSH